MSDLIERLERDGNSWAQPLFNEAAARIRELEAERDTWKEIAITIEKSRDAIREQCAKLCDDEAVNAETWQERQCAKRLGDAFRAAGHKT